MKIKEKQDVSDGMHNMETKFFFTELEQLTNRVDSRHAIMPPKRKRNRRGSFFEFPLISRTFEDKTSAFDSEKVVIQELQKQNIPHQLKKKVNFAFRLKEIMHRQKVSSIVNNFKQKLKRNNCQSKPVQYQPYQVVDDNSFINKNGISYGKWIGISLSLISILQIIFLAITYSLALIFNEVRRNQIVQNFSIFSLFFFFMEILLNLITVKEKDGKKITTLKDIIPFYLKGRFFIDFLCFVILLIDISGQFQIIKYLRLAILLKIGSCFDKLDLLQNQLINSFYKEQYWGLAKVFLLNFFFAHVLSICLLGMAGLTSNNWLTKISAHNAPWYQQYAWSYYWGTTIMLTVGFGDLSAMNYQQAICLTLIETFSCIALAYNINCVGTLISNIRSQDIQKQKKFKIMSQLATRNSIPEQLFWKVNNYIDETTKMKKIFNIQEEKSFISELPPSLKTDFLKQSNKKIFQNISFFKNFTERTLIGLAQKIQMFVSYPQEIIFNQQKASNLLILRQGKIGYITRMSGSDFNQAIINELKVKSGDSPSLLSLDFIFKKGINYEIKTLKYSLMCQIDSTLFREIIKSSSLDYQNYCMILDRSNHLLDEHEITPCQFCSTKHSKMRCPRLHFIPIKQHVINKELRGLKTNKNKRNKKFSRVIRNKYPLLQQYKKFNEEFEGFEEKKIYHRNKIARRSYTMKPKTLENDIIESSKNIDSNFENYFKEVSDNMKIILNQLDVTNKTDVWELESDEIADFKFYFYSQNPKFLGEKYQGASY